MTVVIDASAATALCLSARGFSAVDTELRAPILMRSEVVSAIQGLQWRREISAALADAAMASLLQAPIRLVRQAEVLTGARMIARRLGWAKTYDAEYVALAQMLECPLLTLDVRLARRVRDLVAVQVPGEE